MRSFGGANGELEAVVNAVGRRYDPVVGRRKPLGPGRRMGGGGWIREARCVSRLERHGRPHDDVGARARERSISQRHIKIALNM